ncbi:uncharacterized protein STAUR_2041 [Stigmatella aurantiaca DW4/3-1]|uniref:Uncharacterized protein n=1 Tax=Stigmatella aurantiaca (strain DW4/3-1) TaxID=378806 RepID=E3FYA8_STIAD|nr:uncharacterized protein STAUR_2041 [Stigmatella aurantiaca DW4/3-1]
MRSNFHGGGWGVPSPIKKLFRARRLGLPQTGAEPGLEEESPAFAATVEEPRKERTPRLGVLEVWRQAAGPGVREGSRRGERDTGALGLAHGRCEARAPIGLGFSGFRCLAAENPLAMRPAGQDPGRQPLSAGSWPNLSDSPTGSARAR